MEENQLRKRQRVSIFDLPETPPAEKPRNNYGDYVICTFVQPYVEDGTTLLTGSFGGYMTRDLDIRLRLARGSNPTKFTIDLVTPVLTNRGKQFAHKTMIYLARVNDPEDKRLVGLWNQCPVEFVEVDTRLTPSDSPVVGILRFVPQIKETESAPDPANDVPVPSSSSGF